ncbi:MAG: TPM domain-containing protein [Planctomycetes bacterium]|nr:TPM domain-containing protein [Planctomycetota bacterium]
MSVAQQDIPVPTQYIEDKVGIIDNAIKERLNAYLEELEQKTGTQVIVLTVNSTEGMPIERFALNLASKWQLGQKGKDNGLLIVIAKEDRAYRFEVGYGLESILPDSLCGTIGRELLVPNFRKDDYGKGIFEATVAIISTIAKENRIEITGIPKITYTERGPSNASFLVFLYLLFVIIIIFYIFLQRRYYTGRYWWVGPSIFWVPLTVRVGLEAAASVVSVEVVGVLLVEEGPQGAGKEIIL